MPSSISRGLLLLVGLSCLLSGSQTQDPLELDMSEFDHDHQEHLPCYNITYNIIDLSFALYRKSTSWSKLSNILFSPVNIATSFSMLSLGTKGIARTQILEGLRLNITAVPEDHIHECFQHLIRILHLPDHQPHLTTGSSLFIDQNLKVENKFMKDVKELYNSETIAINFQDTQEAKAQMNTHMEQQTQREIVDVVKDVDKDTALALMSYIAFHGKWYDESEVEGIVEEDFYVDEHTTVKVPMIRQHGRFFLHRAEELATWVMMQHYVGDATAFFLLPDPGKMLSLEEGLSQRHFENILRLIDARSANIYFPKLSISETYDLEPVLSPLGITEVFGNKASLSGITEGVPLKLSKAMHKAVLTLDSQESKVTRNISSDMKALPMVPTIKFNRPFLLIIKDEYTNVVLFVGKIVNPMQQ